MRSHNIGFGFVGLVASVFALNACAAEPEPLEGHGATESNQVSEGRQRAATKKSTTTADPGTTTTNTPATNTPAASSTGSTDSTGAWIDLISGVANAAASAAAKNQGSSGGAGGAPPANGSGDNGGLPVLVTWNGVEGTEASFDVVLNNGHIIGPCAAVDVLRAEFQSGQSDGLGYGFDGHCPSNSEQPAAQDIKSFRICSARNNDWANATCTESAPWNHTNGGVHIDNH